jgi:erythromycin esterase-like protein
VALWAHNLHVAERHDEIVGSYNYGGTARSLGTFLRERRGDGYRALGILAYDTSINWPGIQVGPLPLPTGVDAVEVLLHGLGRPFLLVDLAFGGAADPFLTPGTLYRMHSGSPEYPDRLEPARQFHGLIYLDVSPGMEAVFW